MKSLDISGIAEDPEIENIRNEQQLLYTLMSQDKIIGYVKIGKGRVYILDFDMVIDFPSNTAFVMDTFIQEEFRGKKLFHLLISTTKNDLNKKGYENLYCHIRKDNKISSVAYEKNGFSKVSSLRYMKICGKSFFRFPPESFV